MRWWGIGLIILLILVFYVRKPVPAGNKIIGVLPPLEERVPERLKEKAKALRKQQEEEKPSHYAP